MLIRSTQRHLAAVSRGSGRCHRPVDWAWDSWRNSLLIIIPTCLCIFLKKKKNLLFKPLILTILTQFKQLFSIRKNTYKKFKCNFVMFVDLQGSLWPKLKWKLRKNCLLKISPQIFDKINCLGQFHVFGTFMLYFLKRFQRPL